LAPLGKAWSLNFALAKLATIVNPANKPAKVKWSLSWSRALENCGKLFFNKGLIRDRLLGKCLAFEFGKCFWKKVCLSAIRGRFLVKKNGLPNFLATIVKP